MNPSDYGLLSRRGRSNELERIRAMVNSAFTDVEKARQNRERIEAARAKEKTSLINEPLADTNVFALTDGKTSKILEVNETETSTEKPISKIRQEFRRMVSNNIEPSYEEADELLAKYLLGDTEITIRDLKTIGLFNPDDSFDVDILRRSTFGIYVVELLDSMPEFNKLEDGTYKLKNG